MHLRGGGEFEAIERIARLLPGPPPGETWLGDDAAVVRSPAGPLLLAADVIVEGVHFRTGAALEDVGWKALVVNVSDVAAMGGRPLHALVTVAGPAGTDLDALYRGLAAAAREYGCGVVGGDLANAPSLSVSVAVTGTCPGAPVLRSGARPGDAVFVTGPLGGAAAAGWQARPRARIAEGTAAREAGATAMIDVSDGLGADLGHVAEASGVGVELRTVPVAPGATEEQALGGGEDFELVFTAPDPARVAARFATARLRAPLHIGTCTADTSRRVAATGWEHEWD